MPSHPTCLRSAKLGMETLTPAETFLAGSAAGMLPAIPAAILAASLLERGTLREDASRHEKTKRTKEVVKLLNTIKEDLSHVRVYRHKRDFSPSQSAMDPSTNEVHVSYHGHPALLAHEMGHALNVTKDRETVLGRALSGTTSLAYSPLPAVASMGGMASFALDHPGLGAAGVGVAGILSALQLIEEARASFKARKMLKEMYGDKMPAKDYLLPLGSGFGTYLARAVSLTGSPVAAEVLQESLR